MYLAPSSYREEVPTHVFNSAEYVLEVTDAEVTASSTLDWHAAWIESKELKILNSELEGFARCRRSPSIRTKRHPQHCTTWLYQVATLLQRDVLGHWRDPMYLLAKLVLNVVAGLFIGFTFFKADDSIQGTQNKLFVSFPRPVIPCVNVPDTEFSGLPSRRPFT